MWLGVPLAGALAFALAERWRYRYTAPLAAAAIAWGLIYALTPAYAAEDPIEVPVVAADPLTSLLLSVVGGQVPSGVTFLIIAGLLVRQANGLLDKVAALQWKVMVTFDPQAPRVEIHHPAAHETDPGLSEPSSGRPRPRR